jgi:hypothetical protein
MEKEEKILDVFNLSVDDIDVHNDVGESVVYSPNPDKGKDGVYEALIRFVPNPRNPKLSIVKKFGYWLEDANGNGAFYDSPSTVNEFCPIQDLFFKLRKSESAIDKKNSEKLRRKEVYYSIVQIVEDSNFPQNVGKYKVFRYGYKIKIKIDAELKPKYDEPCQPFDLFTGKDFQLVVTKQAGFPNYDSSKFLSKRSAIKLNGVEMEKNESCMMMIKTSWENAPVLEDFVYKPWTDEQKAKVNECLELFKSPGSRISSMTNQSRDTSVKASAVEMTDSFLKDVPTESVHEEETLPEIKPAEVATGNADDHKSFLDSIDL